MNDPGVGHSPEPRRMVGQRMRIFVVGLITLSLVYVLVSISPMFLTGRSGDGGPLDRCLTEKAVLKFLDGKVIGFIGPKVSTSPQGESITLRKERISSLTIRAGDPPAIRIRFTLEHQGKRYPVEGVFLFTGVDSPELHYHEWGQFMGQVVSDQ